MPVRIPLQAVPNQSFSVLLDNQQYEIAFREIGNSAMAVSMSLNGVVLMSNARFCADDPLIAHPYLEGDGGNFFFVSDDKQIPYYTFFDVTQKLYYLAAAEMADAR